MSELEDALASLRGSIEVARLSREDVTDIVAAMAEALDGLGMAVCVFDNANRTLLWNRHFLIFFPEHNGFVYPGEPYALNLRRFYDARLMGDERAQIERYIEEGVARHELQLRPFTFHHGGRHLRVTCAVLPDQTRVRIWQSLHGCADTRPLEAKPTTLQQLAEHHADGFAILDETSRIISANDEFLRLYDTLSVEDAYGKTLAELVDWIWQRRGGRRSDALLDNARFGGSPFEVELPGERWRRVVEHRLSHGVNYSTHSDITVPKRLHRELTEAREALRIRNAELLILAGTDPLTGVANRRVFDTLLSENWVRAGQTGQWLGLLLVDIDHFKQINDRYGHPRGDRCLRQIAAELGKATRLSIDTVARFGGEEFAIILPGSDLGTAVEVAERIRVAIAAVPLTATPDGISVTVSVGVASTRPCADAAGLDALIEEADRSLYLAKQRGRNRIAFSSAELPLETSRLLGGLDADRR